jgi:hypothetical protein
MWGESISQQPPHDAPELCYTDLNAHQLGGVVDDCVDLGEAHILELLGVGGGDLSTGDTGGGRLKVVEGVLAGQGHDLRGDTERGEARLDAEHVARLLDRLDNGLNVEGLNRAQVDDLSLDAVLVLELLSGDQRLADAAGEGDDGQVLALALNLGLAELRGVSLVLLLLLLLRA